MTTINERSLFFNNKFPDKRESTKDVLLQAQHVMLRILKIFDYICQKHNISYWLEAGTLLGAVRHKGFIPWDDDLDISMMREDFDKFIRIAPKELPTDIFMQTEETDKNWFNRHCPLKLRDICSLIQEEKESLSEPYHQGIFVDVFPYDNKISNKILHKLRTSYTRRLLKIKEAKYYPSRSTVIYRFFSKLYSLASLNKALLSTINYANRTPSDTLYYGYDYTTKGTFPRKAIFPLTRIVFEDAEFSVPGDYKEFLTIKFDNYMELPPVDKRKPKHGLSLFPLLHKEVS